jgi:hypothetical protein
MGGDIDNGSPLRLLVTYEVVTEEFMAPRRRIGIVVGMETRRRFDRVSLNRLWRYTERTPVRVELVNFGVSQSEADDRLRALDAFGMSSVNYSTAYEDLQELVEGLPYRPDVMGVVDVPENQARYGSMGMGLQHLDRAI